MADSALRRMPEFRAALAPQVSDVILSQLREAILLREILPGQRLPSERELAIAFSASRVAVREALAQLQDMGLVERRQGAGGGTFVLPITSRSLGRQPEEMEELLRQLGELLDFREWIEPVASEVAAGRIDAPALARLAADVELSAVPECSHEQFRALDVRFHLGIAEATRNSFLVKSTREIRVLMNALLDVVPFSREVRARSVAQHTTVLEALRRGDAGGARAAMAEHVRATTEEVRRRVQAGRQPKSGRNSATVAVIDGSARDAARWIEQGSEKAAR